MYRHQQRPFRKAQAALNAIEDAFREHQDSRQLLLTLACWLRQVSKSIDTDPSINQLHGEPWLVYLDQHLPDPAFSRGAGQVFGKELYRQNPRCDAQQVLKLCRQWLLATHRNRGRA